MTEEEVSKKQMKASLFQLILDKNDAITKLKKEVEILMSAYLALRDPKREE